MNESPISIKDGLLNARDSRRNIDCGDIRYGASFLSKGSLRRKRDLQIRRLELFLLSLRKALNVDGQVIVGSEHENHLQIADRVAVKLGYKGSERVIDFVNGSRRDVNFGFVNIRTGKWIDEDAAVGFEGKYARLMGVVGLPNRKIIRKANNKLQKGLLHSGEKEIILSIWKWLERNGEFQRRMAEIITRYGYGGIGGKFGSTVKLSMGKAIRLAREADQQRLIGLKVLAPRVSFLDNVSRDMKRRYKGNIETIVTLLGKRRDQLVSIAVRKKYS